MLIMFLWRETSYGIQHEFVALHISPPHLKCGEGRQRCRQGPRSFTLDAIVGKGQNSEVWEALGQKVGGKDLT